MNILDVLKQENTWVIIGDTSNPKKYANKIYNEFKSLGYNIFSVSPYGGENTFKSLLDIPCEFKAIDFCVNPSIGLKLLKEAKNLNIKYLLAQPGARSPELTKYCADNNILYFEGCALVEFKNL
ncbi:MAG: CoA-binding protein [Clostridium perfringens]|nr:CoA-binding protein [Clostridium perfringens]